MDRDDTPTKIREAAQSVVDNLLPEKSAQLYKQCYEQFAGWQKQQKTTSISEDTMLVYFDQLSKELKPSSVWSKYSMLKSTLRNFHNVDITKYSRVTAFLSKNSKGYVPTKSKTLEPKHVKRFLLEAPDDRYLAIKVALIFGITGACRREELKNIKVQDIEHHENLMLIRIPRTKNDVPRKFTVDGEFLQIIKKYEALRPGDVQTDEFFLTLRNGKCTKQVIGINTFGAMPKVIAEYLGLEEPEKYTGHSFRRTSATMLADSGADLLTLKRHGGWKSDKVAQGYVDDSMGSKKRICKQICSSIQLNRQISTESPSTSRLAEENMNSNPIVDTVTTRSSNPQSCDKENSSAATNIPTDKKVAIDVKHCNVTFNFTKD